MSREQRLGEFLIELSLLVNKYKMQVVANGDSKRPWITGVLDIENGEMLKEILHFDSQHQVYIFRAENCANCRFGKDNDGLCIQDGIQSECAANKVCDGWTPYTVEEVIQ